MATRVVKTAGQIVREAFPEHVAMDVGDWEDAAERLGIQPLTEHVPEPPTDGELFEKAYYTRTDWPCAAAEFLRLRAERDGTGEPLPVTGQYLHDRWHTDCVHEDSPWDSLAEKVNRHRGVRPVTVPQVTAEMVRATLDAFYACNKGGAESLAHAADYLNAELAKQAGK